MSLALTSAIVIDESVIGRSFAAKEPPELTCLDFEHAAVGHFVAELGVAYLGIEAAEPGFPERAAALISEEGSAGAVDEVSRAEFAPVEEANGDTIRGEGPEFFHQIESEGGATVTGLVHEAEEGVEPDGIADAG